ncbi:hypothetical protein BCR41DRAFT_245536 [Lobosporangium transversale]|uniref:RING-type domain-containing protein n=1 Tax=Lobosporangium transversale TaxID=64571 RepID=A0A1Y2GU50_9FUNG|nr:hypothetical protein BCR41DRAFT_245536 [Lobosporangium transversale]ORZ23751.1 hypothetical protein BCR41DRAFT_245536 [Lobosporangium transversale]|eukprot:XP_021883565.1 hypothetical protein BCR41DRAFT_245536 [Lobosporangium transversale]
MGYGCEAGFDANTTLPTPELFGLPRVALIRRGGVTEVTACTFRTKMLVAMNDGAVAAIVYNNPGQGSIEGAAAGTDEAETPIEIPGMMVSYDSGFTLRGYLLNSNNATSPSYNTRVRISMSTDRRMPVIWEFVLIVVVVLLGVSFTISVILHCRLYALRQRYRAEAMARGGDLLPNGTIHMRKTIEKAALDEFPVRIYGQSTPSAPSGSAAVSGTLQASTSMQLPTLNHVQQLPELEQDDSKTTREADGHICERDGYSGGHSPQVARTNSVSGRSMRSVTALAAAETLDSAAYPFIPANEIINDTCAICLDEFSEGEEIRTLPCHHEFHCECIGKY